MLVLWLSSLDIVTLNFKRLIQQVGETCFITHLSANQNIHPGCVIRPHTVLILFNNIKKTVSFKGKTICKYTEECLPFCPRVKQANHFEEIIELETSKVDKRDVLLEKSSTGLRVFEMLEALNHAVNSLNELLIPSRFFLFF